MSAEAKRNAADRARAFGIATTPSLKHHRGMAASPASVVVVAWAILSTGVIVGFAAEPAKDETPAPKEGKDLPKTAPVVPDEERLLKKAYSYYNLADYDRAIQSFQDALRINPSSGPARRGMERAEQKRSEVFDAARDRLREKMLREANRDWKDAIPIPLAPPSGGLRGDTTSVGAYYAAKLQEIIFPQVQLTNGTVEEAVEFLRIKSRDYDTFEPDPSKKGVNLVMKPGLAPSRASITVDLKNVSMADALTRITRLAGMIYKVEAYAVVVQPATGGELYTRTFRVRPDFLTAAGGGKKATALEVLKANDIPFPEGASASYVPATSQLIVRNTELNLKIIEALISKLEVAQAPGEKQAVSRGRIEVIYFERQSPGKPLGERFVDAFIGAQIETLQSSRIHLQVEQLLKNKHPEMALAPVTVSVARADGGSDAKVVATLTVSVSSTDEVYAAHYLSSLLDEVEALRKEQFEKSIFGTMQKVDDEVLEREKQVVDSKVKLDTAIGRNAPQGTLDKLKSQFQKAEENYQSWVTKAESMRASLERVPALLDIRIAERPGAK